MVSTGLSDEDPVTEQALEYTKSPSVFFQHILDALRSSPSAADNEQSEMAMNWSRQRGKVCIFLIIFFSVPDTSATNYFYLTNHLGMGEKVLALITTVAMGTYLVGVVMYEKVFKEC